MANTTEAGPGKGKPDPDTVAEMIAAVAAARSEGNDMDRLPKRLSPSRASDYAQCPTLFYFKTIVGLREPATIATTRGTLAHAAFERIFDHPEGQRTIELAQSYIAPAWEQMTSTDLDPQECPPGSKEEARALESARDYRRLAPAGSAAEAELLASAKDMVANWFLMERVNNFSPTGLELPDGTVIDGREFHAAAEMFGVNVHGFIDRLDRYVNARGEVIWTVSDYKTGKPVGAGKTYRPETMRRITYEAFFQLRVYAVLCKEMLGIDVKYLRLVYVKTGDRDTGIKTLQVTPQVLAGTREELRTIWRRIMRNARTGTWPTRPQVLCNWCYFNDICPQYNPELAGIPLQTTSA